MGKISVNKGTSANPSWVVFDAQDAQSLQGKVPGDFTPIAHIGTGGAAHAIVTTSANGFMSAADKIRLNAMSDNANNVTVPGTPNGTILIDGVAKTVYTHPATHPGSIITEDTTHRWTTDAEKATWNATTSSYNNPLDILNKIKTVDGAGSGLDAEYLAGKLGTGTLATVEKNNIITAINELFTYVNNGKNAVAAAIVDKGIAASGSDSFDVLASKIRAISTAYGNAVASDVLVGKTFRNNTGANLSGTMPNNGVLNYNPSGYGAQSIPAGYTAGGTIGQVIVPAGSVLSGTTIAGVGGTMPNNGPLNFMPTTFNQGVPGGYTSGGVVYGAPNLVPGNIKMGVDIFGVVGNMGSSGIFGVTPAKAIESGAVWQQKISVPFMPTLMYARLARTDGSFHAWAFRHDYSQPYQEIIINYTVAYMVLQQNAIWIQTAAITPMQVSPGVFELNFRFYSLGNPAIGNMCQAHYYIQA